MTDLLPTDKWVCGFGSVSHMGEGMTNERQKLEYTTLNIFNLFKCLQRELITTMHVLRFVLTNFSHKQFCQLLVP